MCFFLQSLTYVFCWCKMPLVYKRGLDIMRFMYREFARKRAEYMLQTDFAEKTGISIHIINNIENGRRLPTEEELIAFGEALKIDLEPYIKKDCFVIPFIASKGGSAKTSCCVNIAYALATKHNKRILIIDTDMQLDTTDHLGMLFEITDEQNFYEAFVNKQPLTDHIRKTGFKNIDIVTSHPAMAAVENHIYSMHLKELRVQQIMESVREQGEYDFVFIDCNPYLGFVNRSIIYASDAVVIPLVTERSGLRGAQYVVSFLEEIKTHYPSLTVMGLLPSRMNMRKRISKEVIEFAEKEFGSKKMLFDTRVPEDAAVANAHAELKPVGAYAPKSKAYVAYKALAVEIIEKSERIVRKNGKKQ